MTDYRIIPLRRVHRVEAVEEDGQISVVRAWPTEEEAVTHLKHVRARASMSVAREIRASRTGSANAFELRDDDTAISPKEAKAAWRQILENTLDAEDLKNLHPDD